MIAQRVLAVFAAVFLVAAVGLATLAPPDLPLGQMLLLSGAGNAVKGAEAASGQYLAPWAWTYLAKPVLIRPAWLIPAAIGIVFAGLAVSVAPRRGAPRPRRRG